MKMRELYAVELHGTNQTRNHLAWNQVQTWAERHIADDDPSDRDAAHVVIEEASDGQHLVVLTQIDDGDPTQRWRSEVAVGRPDDPLDVSIRVRLGAVAGSPVAPLDYEFGTPAIVRTLLRDFEVLDAGIRELPSFVELGMSNIPSLVEWIANPARRLPIVVVSRTPDTGRVLLDCASLARELAGIGHVRVLAASHAAWGLTNQIGQQLSVWNGAVRIYFPGFALGDPYRRHRVWIPDHVDNGLISRLRSWLGALSSGSTPEHPIHERLRLDRRERLSAAADTDELGLLYEYIDDLEAQTRQHEQDQAEQQARIAELEYRAENLLGELDSVKQNFADMAEAVGRRSNRPATSDGFLTIATAMDAVEELSRTRYYRDRVTLSDDAIDAGRRFRQYTSPDELLRAIQAVMEAGALVHDGKLAVTPMEFFNYRGFGYAAQPTPHLKVDESTSPDQCLRIYWTVDDNSRRWTITHIGEHL
jgi:hypothetical protein